MKAAADEDETAAAAAAPTAAAAEGWEATAVDAEGMTGERQNRSRTSSPVDGVSPSKLSRDEDEEEDVGEAVASSSSPNWNIKDNSCSLSFSTFVTS